MKLFYPFLSAVFYSPPQSDATQYTFMYPGQGKTDFTGMKDLQSITIHNAKGETMNRIFPVESMFVWNGLNHRGQKAESGVYFITSATININLGRFILLPE